jgi:hypothetical protein
VDTETPRPEKLVVDFDTTVNSSPTDISGRGNHGTFYGGAYYSAAEKAFFFDGTDDYIDIPSVSGVGTGAWVHSKSFWFKLHSSTDPGILFLLGRNGSTRQIAVQVNGSGQFQYFIYGCNSRVQVNGSDWFPDVNRWYHCVTVFRNNETTADGSVLTGREMYIDGVKQTLVAIGNQIALDLDSSEVRFGNQFNSNYLDYELSNPKLYSVALEPSEVRKLYNLGRTGRSMVISDTAVGIGKAPEAQLDVRGVANFERVGIGTNNPLTMLHVNGASGTTTSGNMNYFSHSNGTTLSEINGETWAANGISIWASDSIMTKTWIISHNGTISASDHRIKKDIIDVNDASALETLRLLKPKKYSYKDNVARDKEPVWGFIAQEVGATLPYSTQLRRETIPNIYELANVSDSNVITFTNFDTSTLESNTFVMKVFDTKNNEHMVNLTEVIDEHSIRVNKDLSKWTANVVTGNQIFVYGQEVDDFTFLKKDAIWTVATAALQEVDRQLQNEKIRNDTLETQVSDLLARVTALENA